MKNFKEYLLSNGFIKCKPNKNFPVTGELFYINEEYYRGLYWFYESEYFIINIHDLFIKKEMVTNSFRDTELYMSLSVSYIMAANGEWFSPYQSIIPNSILVTNVKEKDMRFLLHKDCPYVSVGINFKEKMLNEYLAKNPKLNQKQIMDIFFKTRDEVVKSIESIANEILNCKMEGVSADIFFEAKAKEWLSITMDTYYKKIQKTKNSLSEVDKKDIEIVAEYINNHFSFNISQDLLEKIALMSGTKLKTTFKSKYKMSITEYIQRKRINMAENLLLTTELSLKDIANSVGYTSHSRFSTLFKRYKGIYPKEVRQFKLNKYKSEGFFLKYKKEN